MFISNCYILHVLCVQAAAACTAEVAAARAALASVEADARGAKAALAVSEGDAGHLRREMARLEAEATRQAVAAAAGRGELVARLGAAEAARDAEAARQAAESAGQEDRAQRIAAKKVSLVCGGKGCIVRDDDQERGPHIAFTSFCCAPRRCPSLNACSVFFCFQKRWLAGVGDAKKVSRGSLAAAAAATQAVAQAAWEERQREGAAALVCARDATAARGECVEALRGARAEATALEGRLAEAEAARGAAAKEAAAAREAGATFAVAAGALARVRVGSLTWRLQPS